MKKLLTIIGGVALTFAFVAQVDAAAFEVTFEGAPYSILVSDELPSENEAIEAIEPFIGQVTITLQSEETLPNSFELGAKVTEGPTDHDLALWTKNEGDTETGFTNVLSKPFVYEGNISTGMSFTLDVRAAATVAGTYTIVPVVTIPGEDDETTTQELTSFTLEVLDIGIAITPQAGEVPLRAGENFVMTVAATGTGAHLVHELEVDVYNLDGLLEEHRQFSVYANTDNPYDSDPQQTTEKTKFENAGLAVVYDNSAWTLEFGEALTNMFLNSTDPDTNPNPSLSFALRDAEGVGLYGVNENDDNLNDDGPSHPTYSVVALPKNVLSVDFGNQTMREGRTETFSGKLNLENWEGETFTGAFTVKVDSIDGLTVTSENLGDITEGLLGGLSVPFSFNNNQQPPFGNPNLKEGDDDSMDLNLTITASKQGTYEFTVDGGAHFDDEVFTLTVDRRRSGGGGGSSSSNRVDRDDRQDDRTDERQEETAAEAATGLLSLLADIDRINEMSSKERAEFIVRVFEAVANLSQNQSAPTIPSVPTVTFTRDLTIGSQGQDVVALQTNLIAHGYAIPAGATGYFGTQTQSALSQFQAANGISPTAGYFGPVTRGFMVGN